MSIRRSVFQIIVMLGFVGAAACAQSDGAGAAGRLPQSVAVIESENGRHEFKVELADEPGELELGLMHRTELAADAGMLFDFGESITTSMWMKNTLIPLDMAFLDERGFITRIAENTQPRSLAAIASGGPVLAVLEVNGGTFERLGVKVGDRVRHPIFVSSD